MLRKAIRYFIGDPNETGFHASFVMRPGIGENNSPQFAYDAQALYRRSIISGAVASGSFAHFTPQIWGAQWIRTDGMPTGAGQIEPPRLYVPADELTPLLKGM